MKKNLTRLLSILLALVLTVGMLPVSALADGWQLSGSLERGESAGMAESIGTQATDNSDFIRVFHLDCGRKYFSVAEVNSIIDTLSANHYTHIELAFGNEGLRFVLNENRMAVGDYSGSEVVAAIASGNKSYDTDQTLSYKTDAWTESDMEEILAHAKEKNIEIIPMFDIPGHMNAVISAMQQLGISVEVFSQVNQTYPGNIGRSFDTTNGPAVSFATGLVENYIKYFAKQGCKYFNIAGDECGFASMSYDQYNAYIDLMNSLNATVKSNGMTTMMFNDGIYNLTVKSYDENKTFDTDILICYWDASEDKYTQASELAAKGFKLLNTNNKWYYVAGNEGSTWFGYQWALNYMNGESRDCTLVDGSYKTSTGCMLAFWCDNPTKNVNTTNLTNYIATLANNNPDYFKASETPAPDQFTITSSTRGPLKIGDSLTLTASAAANWTTAQSEIVEVSPSDDATQATVTAKSAGTATITAAAQSDAAKTATYTVTVADSSTPSEAKQITMTVGDAAHTETQTGFNYQGSVTDTADSSIATVKVSGTDGENTLTKAASISSGSYYISDGSGNFLTLDGSSLTNTTNQSEATLWTISKSGTSYTIKSGNYYLHHSNNRLGVFTQNNSASWSYSGTTGFSYSRSAPQTYYLCFSSSGWEASHTNSNYGGAYTGTQQPASTTITFTPVAEGTTEITVGSVRYVITVKAKEANVNIQLMPDQTLDLKTQIKEAGTVAYETVSANDVTVNESVLSNGKEGGGAVVKATVTSAAGRAVAVYTFTISVVTEDLSKAEKLPIQLWITNQAIQVDQDGYTSADISGYGGSTNLGVKAQYIYITADKAYGENGVELSKCVPEFVNNHYEEGGLWWIDEKSGKTATDFKLYKGVRLTVSTDGYQNIWGESKVNSGDSFQFIRYYDGAWSASNDRSNWFTVTGNGSDKTYSSSNLKEQLIAYYYMRTKLTDEVITDVVDWGDPINGQTNYALLDFAVKYEGGTRIPDTFPNGEKTRVMSASGNVVMSGNYRIVDQIDVTNTTGYELYMITLTPTSGSLSSTVPSSYTYDDTQEKVTWAKSVDDLPADYRTSDRWYTDQSGYTAAGDSLTFNATTGMNVGGSPALPFVEIEKQTGMLITYYIRAKETPDSLKVCYVDKNQGTEFYSYFINVHQNTTFKDSVKLADQWKGDLINGNVTNVNDKEQWVSADLSTMPAIGAQYRYVDYTCDQIELSSDKKTLTLYYTFDNSVSFIYDFGLPLTITAERINKSLIDQNVTLDELKVFDSEYGSVTVNGTNSFTYTPNTADAQTDTLSVSFKGWIPRKDDDGKYTIQDGTVTYRVSLIPASNVLYEENFLTEVEGDRPGWTADTTQQLTGTAQVAHKADDEARFGYDVAYESITGRNGAWKTSVSKDATVSNALTATFYGNALDVIGSCGAGTAMLMFVIRTPGEKAKSVLVDTRYSEGTLEQVPFAHIELGDTDAQHTVLVRAYYAAATTTSGNSAVSVMSARASSGSSAERLVLAQMELDLAEDGLTLSDVEFVNAADTLTARSSSSIASYAAVNAATIARGEGTMAAIDAFRVYRSTDNTSYIDSEKGVVYENVLDAIDGEVVTAYREGDNGSTEVAINDYESTGGPQNEIYLRNGNSVVFAVDNQAATQIQVSLRAVDTATEWNGTGITSNTEMYYVLNNAADSDGKQVFAITNTGNDLLAIGNVKLPAGTGTNDIIPASELPTDVVLQALRAVSGEEPSEPEPEVFDPDTFDANVSTLRLLRSKLVTIRISVSSDVSYVTVNGEKYWPGRTFSWQRSRTIQFRDTIGRNQSKTYTIIAYDANGVASAPITVNG